MHMQNTIKVWDLPTRIFHWLLVVAFFLAYFTEDDLLTLHVWAGYVVVGLIIFRLIWGFTGNTYARFANFLCKPSLSLAYLRDALKLKAPRYLGHNPAGAAMIVLLLIGLSLTVVTGLIVFAADQNAGPLAGLVASTHEKFWEEAHEIAANFTLLLVGAHIAGVIFESLVHKESLVKAMLTGYKQDNKS